MPASVEKGKIQVSSFGDFCSGFWETEMIQNKHKKEKGAGNSSYNERIKAKFKCKAKQGKEET